MNKWRLFLILGLLTGCATPPEPPVVDGTTRQPINKAEAIEQEITSQSTFILPTIPQRPSRIFYVYFPMKSTKVGFSGSKFSLLKFWLAKSDRIEIRGTIEGQNLSMRDDKTLLDRMLAVQQYLLQKGVPRTIVSIHYQSTNERKDNKLKTGRHQNNCVEIEIFTHEKI